MDLENQRRSSNVEDRRGQGGGGGGGLSGVPLGARGLGLGGIIIIGLLLLLAPPNVRQMILSQLGAGGSSSSSSSSGPARACTTGEEACDFATRVLGSTEDVWRGQFQQSRLPNYGRSVSAYEDPRLVLFEGSVTTGCGGANAGMGPFYCPTDRRLYIDPTFYETLARRLNAPGDFAQAYVIAHEVAHHVQNLIGATQAGPQESRNQHSVRIELQADCLAGVWGNQSRTNLRIDESDLREALGAAHAIGDDTLQRNSRGSTSPTDYTHGTSDQRMRWFQRGYQSGDARQCDTMTGSYNAL